MSECARAYREVRHNLGELLRQPDLDSRQVPACPEWTVRELLAHLVDVAAFVVGRLSGRPSPGPAADMDLPGLLGEWDRLGPLAEQLVAEAGSGDVMLMDAFTHELDLRRVAGVAWPEEHRAFAGSFETLVRGFSASVLAHDLPGLRLSTEDRAWSVGEPVATVSAGRYDLLRSLAGRRTHEQIAGLDWDCDPRPWLPAFAWGPFTPPSTPVE